LLRFREPRRPEGDVLLFRRVAGALAIPAQAPRDNLWGTRHARARPALVVIALIVMTVCAAAMSVTAAVASQPRTPAKQTVRPTPIEPDAASLVRVSGGSPSETGHLMLATIPLPATLAQAHDAVTRTLIRDGSALMRDSARAATMAAARCLARPITTSVDSGPVHGSSGGLMLTLTIIDQATPGDLTRGHHVAGTGVILPNGRLLPVMSVREKVLIAERAGADLFLVPAPQQAEAKGAARAMHVVGVRNLNDALYALGYPGGCASLRG
jgi:PDZ domain-containing secreted protein